MRPGARASGLPFNLERYNVTYMAILSLIVLAGTLYSVVHKTHTFNVLLSDAQDALQVDMHASANGQSAIEQAPLRFLADRRNFLNRFFTKFAWFWTSAAFLTQIATLRNKSHLPDAVKTSGSKTTSEHSHASTENSAEREKNEVARQKNTPAASATTDVNLQATIMGAMSISLLRFVIATLIWIFFARWFIGPSLMARVRHYTGATCVPIQSSSTGTLSSLAKIDAQYCYSGKSLSSNDAPHLFTHTTDSVDSSSTSETVKQLLRPRWRGGHDISGHTFILITSTLYLLEEITPFLPYLFPNVLQAYVARIIPKPLWSPQNPFVASAQQTQQAAKRNLLAISAILALVMFWTLSLGVTAVYFHTPQEKISGLLVALTASLLIPKGG